MVTGFFVHHRIVSAVKSVEFVSDRVSCIVLRGRWCNISVLNGTHQFLVYADDVTILGGSVHTVKENAEALVVASKEIGL